MKRILRQTPLLIATVLFGAEAVEAQTQDEVIKLRDGRLLVAEIAEHDLDGLQVVNIRNQGRYHFGWADLFPGEAERLKRALGYRVDDSQPMVTADRLVLINGQELIGRILRRDARVIELRRRDSTTLVPVQRLASPPEPVTVEAQLVLTPEQFYNERSLEVDPTDGLANYEFARELQSVFALEQAREHLQLALELAEADGDQALARRAEGGMGELALALENLEQAQALEEVRQLIHRERFAEAKQKLEDFGEDYPNSPLRGEWVDLGARFDEQRENSMVRYLMRNWFNASVALLKRKALDRNAQVDDLLSWCESDLPEAMRKRMAEDLKTMKEDLDESEIDALWAQRLESGAKRHQASFGDGTFVLGEEKARAGLVTAAENEDDGKSPEQRELEERMRRYLENLNRARSRAGGTAEVTPEDWWRKATVTARFQFLLAYYGEFSGDYEITRVRFDSCPTCAGAGVLTFLDASGGGSQERKQPCPTCHKVQVRRALTFR